MYEILHLGLGHIGPLVVMVGLALAVAAALWYILERIEFKAEPEPESVADPEPATR